MLQGFSFFECIDGVASFWSGFDEAPGVYGSCIVWCVGSTFGWRFLAGVVLRELGSWVGVLSGACEDVGMVWRLASCSFFSSSFLVSEGGKESSRTVLGHGGKVQLVC